jgi:hypothetical protein
MALTANSFSANALFISIVVDDFMRVTGIIVRGLALWGGWEGWALWGGWAIWAKLILRYEFCIMNS